MIISTIKQFGLKLYADPEEIPFQYSSNIQMQFIKDENYNDYTVVGYYIPPGENEAKLLSINDDGTFILGPDCFKQRGTLSFSFNLINSIEEVHLGSIDFEVRYSFGDGDTILPEPEEVWISLVTQVAKDAIREEVALVKQKANEALQSASLANDKANEAQEYANNANQSAGSASLSASSALTAKNDAIAATNSAIQAKQDAEQSANNAKNSANTALENANKSTEAIETVTQIKTEIENKANDFDTNYQEKLKSFNDNATSKQNAFDNSVQTANTNFDNKVTQANSDLDAKVQEATKQAQKAKEEADRATQATDGKLDKNLGVENAGKSLVVGENGEVVCGESGINEDEVNKIIDKAIDEKLYTQEEVDYLLADKMDKPYVPIEITDNATITDALEGNFKIDKIKGNTYQNVEENIVPTPQRPVPINSRKVLANGEYVELRSLKETINKFDLGLLSQTNLITNSGAYRKIEIPITLKPNTRYKIYYEKSMIPALTWSVLDIVDNTEKILAKILNVKNTENNEVEKQAINIAFTSPIDGEIYFSYFVQSFNAEGVQVPQNTEVFKEKWFTKILKNIMITEESLNQNTYVLPTIRDYKIVDHKTKTSKIVRNVKNIDLSSIGYQYQTGIDDKPYRVANYIYNLTSIQGSCKYIYANSEKVYSYNGFQSQMENGLCVSEYGIMRVVNGVTNEDELKTYVDNNRVDILYALAIPTEESIPYVETDESDYGVSFQDTTSPSPDIPSEIYEVTDLNIKTTGKNFANGEITKGFIVDATGELNPSGIDWAVSDYIKLVKDKIYTISFNKTIFNGTNKIIFYDINKQFVKTITSTSTFTMEMNGYIRFNCKKSSGTPTDDEINNLNFQVEEGTTATPYQPYQESSITHHLAKPLRATKDGSVRDVIDVVNMQTTYNMKDVLLDGTQNINAENNNIYNIVMSDINYIGGIATAFCEKYIGVSYQKRNDYDTCICAAIGRVLIRNTKTNSNKELKEELTQNPITVLYATSQPITEPLEDELIQKLKTLKTFSPTTHVFVEGVAKPKLNAKYPKDIAAAQAQLEAKVVILQEEVVKNV